VTFIIRSTPGEERSRQRYFALPSRDTFREALRLLTSTEYAIAQEPNSEVVARIASHEAKLESIQMQIKSHDYVANAKEERKLAEKL